MTQTHPTDADLWDFVLGKLQDHESDAVETHLFECPACLDRAAADQPTDTLLDLLAAANTRVDRDLAAVATPRLDARETPSLGSATLSFAGSSRLDLAAMTPPPELANHPKYRVVRPLGFGGMGTVWLAEHLVMGRRVAVKVIRPECVARPGMAERFRREVLAAAKLAHENIATAYDAEEVGGRHFLVMEYVPGESLAEAVRGGPLPAAEACRAIRDAARGLAHAHAAGLVHRDVKPSNLVRTPDGITKVLDFGLATVAGHDGPTLTGGNVVMGTPDYIAPEQAADPHAADARSDIYSLGCTLYHLLSGRVPYPADSVWAKIDAHRDPARAPQPIPHLAPALADVVTRMMATNPADRYPTAGDVAAALEPFAEGALLAPRAGSGSARGASRVRSRWLVAAGVLFAVVGLAVAGVVYKIQRDNEVITISTDDPDIEVVMKRNGELIRIVDSKTKQAWELDTKKLRLKPDGGELTIDLPEKGPLVIRRNGDVAVTIRWDAANVKPPAGKSSPLGPLAVTDFRELHDADVAELRKWCDKLPVGFYPASVTARGSTKTPVFDAVAIRDDRRVKFEVHFALGGNAKQADFDAMSRNGWALKTACTYPVDGKVLRHHVWVTDDGKGWLADGIQLGGLPEAIERWKRARLRPTNFWLNESDIGKGLPTRALGVLLEPDQGVVWTLSAELGAKELVVELTAARKQGLRPDALGALGDGKNRTYALSLVPNPDKLGWEFQTNLTADSFETSTAEQKKLNRRPLSVLSEGEGVATTYTAVWIEYARTN